MDEFFGEYISQLTKSLASLDTKALQQIRDELLTAREQGRNVFVVGNGGSASTASHMANDLSKGVLGHAGDKDIKRFRIVSLTDNVSIITAWANDTAYEKCFSEPLKALIDAGDLLIAISASGNSKNVLNAVDVAKQAGARVIGLAGFDGGALETKCDVCLTARIPKYDVVEDIHMIVSHVLTRWFFENLRQ